MLRIPFEEKISDTLTTVRGLGQPVIRSCHIGNNGSYNFGWLALAGNTRFVMYDHTTYGADRLCFPWMVLGDYGRIKLAFDYSGVARAELVGRHVREPETEVASRYRSLLNYGIAATVGDRHLTTWHFQQNSKIATAINGKIPTFDSEAILEHYDLLSHIVRTFAAREQLGNLFDRWVVTRRGRTVLLRIGDIKVDGGRQILIKGTDGAHLFQGSIGDLLAATRKSIEVVVSHIIKGTPLTPVSYPWPRLVFSYLFGSTVEFALAPQQTTFFHAGGLTSPYYMLDQEFLNSFTGLAKLMMEDGFLPHAFELAVLPIGVCQLFARRDNVEILEVLLSTAVKSLRAQATSDSIRGALRSLGGDLAQSSHARLPLLEHLGAGLHEKIRHQVRMFNQTNRNRLPVWFRGGAAGTRYGAMGAGDTQDADIYADITFPGTLGELTWGEAEWILQALGELFVDEPEDMAVR